MENVIGEIWSELEEGSVLECPFALAGLFFVYVLLAKMRFYLFLLHFWKTFKITWF